MDNCPKKPESAIDFGCGAGILSEWLTEQGIKVKGIDSSQELIDNANRHARLSGLNIEYTCSNSIQEQKTKVDLIACMEVLEHCDNYEDLICTFAGKLNKGGTLCVSTINNTWEAFFKVILAAEYILNIVPKGTHQKNSFIKPSELIRNAKKYRLELTAISGMAYQPYSRKCNKTDDLSSNYIAIFKKF